MNLQKCINGTSSIIEAIESDKNINIIKTIRAILITQKTILETLDTMDSYIASQKIKNNIEMPNIFNDIFKNKQQ